MSGKLSYIIAASALILMIVLIVANAIYIKSITGHILTLVDQAIELSNNSSLSITEIYDFWEKSIPTLKLTLSQRDIEEISLIIDEAKISLENNDNEEYQRTMARLRRAIESITKREEFSIDNIL